MCGIAGIVGFQKGPDDLSARLERMRVAVRHRGPDDEGVFVAAKDGAGLVHTRLAILDLSAAGHQPMQSADGRFTITFNGEIYNFRELRCELEKEGVKFRSGTDTEVILELFRRVGKNGVASLRGMFALGIWDALEKRLLLARDPLGIKPLYYAVKQSSAGRDSELVFASELRALVASGLVSGKLSERGLSGYFRMGSVPEPFTILRDVRMLEAGCLLEWKKATGVTKSRYWSYPRAVGPAEEGGRGVASVRAALLDSIEHHFISDVPVGVFLSGGIDSTALVALAREIGHEDLRTYSIALEDPRWNEGEVARRTAEHFRTNHSELVLTGERARKLFVDYLDRVDQPSIDGFNTFCISNFARQMGIKVVLSGLGGDEFFGGYPSFEKIPKMMRSRCWMKVAGGGVGRMGAWLERGARSRRWKKVGEFLQGPPTLRAAYDAVRGIFTRREVALLTEAYLPELRDTLAESEWFDTLTGNEETDSTEKGKDGEMGGENHLEEIGRLEATSYMRNQLLRDSDVMSMACGLELRVPFVDRHIVELLSTVPPAERYRPGKQMLIDAVPPLPAWVVNRPKRGFHLPFEGWLGKEWTGLAAPEKTPPGVRMETWDQKRALFILDHCLRQLIC